MRQPATFEKLNHLVLSDSAKAIQPMLDLIRR